MIRLKILASNKVGKDIVYSGEEEWGKVLNAIKTLNTWIKDGTSQDIKSALESGPLLKGLRQAIQKLGKYINCVNPLDANIQVFFNVFHIGVFPNTFSGKVGLLGKLEDICKLGQASFMLQKWQKNRTHPEVTRAILTIQTLKEQDPEESGWIDQTCQLFFPDINFSLLTQCIALERQKCVSAFIRDRFRKALGIETDTKSEVPTFYPRPQDFSEETLILLKALSKGQEGDKLDSFSYYFELVSDALGLKLEASLFLSLIPQGNSGEQLDKEIADIQIPELQKALKAFLARLRERSEKGKARFESAEKRIGDMARHIKAQEKEAEARCLELCEFFKKTEESLLAMCSIGWDLQLLSGEQELIAILESDTAALEREAEITCVQQAAWVKDRMITVLRLIGIGEEWVSDVHHINYGVVLVLTHLNPEAPIPDALKDEHIVAWKERMDLYKTTLIKAILRPDQFVSELYKEEAESLHTFIEKAVQKGILSQKGEGLLLSLKETQDLIWNLLSLAEKYPRTFRAILLGDERAKENVTGVVELDAMIKSKGLNHGLLGEAARWGNYDGFLKVQAADPIVSRYDLTKQDGLGKTLLGYAIIGGSVELVDHLDKDSSQIGILIEAFEQNETAHENPLMLAVQSGNPRMITRTLQGIPEAKKARFLNKVDSHGNTLVMEALKVKSKDSLLIILEALRGIHGDESVMIHLNLPNSEGQTALMIAAVQNKIESAQVLLRNGTIAEYRNSHTDLDFIGVAALEVRGPFILESLKTLEDMDPELAPKMFMDNIQVLIRYGGSLVADWISRFEAAEQNQYLSTVIISEEYTVAHELLIYNPESLRAVLTNCRTLDEKIQILTIKDTGLEELVLEILDRHPGLFMEIVKQCQSLEEVITLLKVPIKDRALVHILDLYYMTLLKEILELYTKKGQRLKLLATHEVGHCIAQKYGDVCIEILRSCDEEEALEILKLESGPKNTIWKILNETHKDLFLKWILEQRDAQKYQILGLGQSEEIALVGRVDIIQTLNACREKGTRSQILALKVKGKDIFQKLWDMNPKFLLGIIQECPFEDEKIAFLERKEESGQRIIDLCLNRHLRLLRDTLYFLSSRGRQHILNLKLDTGERIIDRLAQESPKLLVSLLNYCTFEEIKSILADSLGKDTLVHVMATVEGSIIINILKFCQTKEEKYQILKMQNKQGQFLYQHHQVETQEDIQEIVSNYCLKRIPDKIERRGPILVTHLKAKSFEEKYRVLTERVESGKTLLEETCQTEALSLYAILLTCERFEEKKSLLSVKLTDGDPLIGVLFQKNRSIFLDILRYCSPDEIYQVLAIPCTGGALVHKIARQSPELLNSVMQRLPEVTKEWIRAERASLWGESHKQTRSQPKIGIVPNELELIESPPTMETDESKGGGVSESRHTEDQPPVETGKSKDEDVGKSKDKDVGKSKDEDVETQTRAARAPSQTALLPIEGWRSCIIS